MSKWGHVDSYSAKTKFERQPDEAVEMVVEMSNVIVKQDDTIREQDRKIIELQTELMGSREIECQLRGYVDRVRELDPKQLEPDRRAS